MLNGCLQRCSMNWELSRFLLTRKSKQNQLLSSMLLWSSTLSRIPLSVFFILPARTQKAPSNPQAGKMLPGCTMAARRVYPNLFYASTMCFNQASAVPVEGLCLHYTHSFLQSFLCVSFYFKGKGAHACSCACTHTFPTHIHTQESTRHLDTKTLGSALPAVAFS